MTNLNLKLKKTTAIVCIIFVVSIFFSPLFSKTTNAQAGAVSSAVAVPISTGFDFNITMDHIKKFILDGLAWHIAKIMVQQITAETVAWINSGFQGSPAFLTNPSGYFADIGDQVTGMFIANTGILSGLCSPFNVDVRLSIALGQAGYGQVDRYSCTLNSVINNVKNSTINGATIGGFMNGDFKQGGWPAFIALSQSNNNSSGVYLQAHSDLLQQIGAKQGTVNQQLAQGGGFLSWQSCTNVSSGQAQATANLTGSGSTFSAMQNSANQNLNISQLQNIQQGGLGGTNLNANFDSVKNPVGTAKPQSINTGNGSSITTSVGSDGNLSYQNCETKTPGSVINSSLEKVMGAGIDQLNLANSFNQIVDALLAQLVSKVLSNGLGGTTQRSSGDTQSYINQLSTETNSAVQYQKSSQDIASTFAPYLATASQTVTTYQQIVLLFETTKSSLQTAATCLKNIESNPLTSTYNISQYPNSAISSDLLGQVNSKITELNSAEASYQTSLQIASSSLINYQSQASQASNVASADQLQSSSQTVQDFVTTQVPLIQQASLTSQSDMTTAQTLIAQYADQAKQFMNQCTTAGGK